MRFAACSSKVCIDSARVYPPGFAVYIALDHNISQLLRMHIFKEGRTSFLEFLRNLTPQAFILTFALVAGYRFEPTCCYPQNTKQTAIFICLLAVWLIAVWANSSLFIEKYLVSVERINRASRLLIRLGVVGLRNLRALLLHAWRKERSIFLETVIVFAVVEFGLVVVIISASGSATTFIKALHS
jgi:hypothetical protein